MLYILICANTTGLHVYGLYFSVINLVVYEV